MTYFLVNCPAGGSSHHLLRILYAKKAWRIFSIQGHEDQKIWYLITLTLLQRTVIRQKLKGRKHINIDLGKNCHLGHRVMKYVLIPLRRAIDSDALIGFPLLDLVNVSWGYSCVCVCVCVLSKSQTGMAWRDTLWYLRGGLCFLSACLKSENHLKVKYLTFVKVSPKENTVHTPLQTNKRSLKKENCCQVQF